MKQFIIEVFTVTFQGTGKNGGGIFLELDRQERASKNGKNVEDTFTEVSRTFF